MEARTVGGSFEVIGGRAIHERVPYTEEELRRFYDFATEAQQRYIEAVIENGSFRAAAEVLGVHNSTVQQAVTRASIRATNRVVNPGTDQEYPLPAGQTLKGVSDFVDKDGNIKHRWIKTKENPEENLLQAVDAIKEAFALDSLIVPLIDAPVPAIDSDLCIAYPMGDPHIGMYAWAEETGEDFDVEIAEANLVDATRRCVECAPNAEQAIIVNVGDFYHADNQLNRTMRSGHQLDVDTRWAKVLRVGVRAMRSCIELALMKHEKVHVINEIGNHDDHTSQVLTLALALAYEQNPRVTFDESPMRFHYFQWGRVLIGVHHGDMVKPGHLGGIMSADQPRMWADTDFRYWYTGHIHTEKKFELPGCTVESFRTLAGKDAWTHGSGYRSGRDMYCIALHKEFGEIERHRVDIKMLGAKHAEKGDNLET